MSKSNEIIVAGGGIAGLTLALALLRRGISVEVHEQVATPGEIGAGLQLGPNGTRCLFSLGLGDALREIASEPMGKEVRLWNTGQRWRLFDLGATAEARFGFPYLTVHRGDLHHLLMDAVQKADAAAIRIGSQCVGFKEDADAGGVEVLFGDGSSRHGRVLVGADGVHSKVREGLFGMQRAVFTGCMAWRGLVPSEKLPAGLADAVGVNWIGPGAHVVTYPVRAGRLMNFVGVVARSDWKVESWTESGTVQECLNDFAGWHSDVHTLIRHIDQPFKWALLGREPLPSWSRGRIVLMGDAAHPTLPFLAQGAGMAIEDGIVLARCIDAFASDLPQALRSFEAARIERASSIVRGSAENTRRFHNPALASPEGAQAYVDNEWAEDKVHSRYDWLFTYDALAQPIARELALS